MYNGGTFILDIYSFNQKEIMPERTSSARRGEWNRRRRASRLSPPERPAARRVVARASHRRPSNPETRCRSADTRRHRFRRRRTGFSVAAVAGARESANARR